MKRMIFKIVIMLTFILLVIFILCLLPVQQFIMGLDINNFWVKLIIIALGVILGVLICADIIGS